MGRRQTSGTIDSNRNDVPVRHECSRLSLPPSIPSSRYPSPSLDRHGRRFKSLKRVRKCANGKIPIHSNLKWLSRRRVALYLTLVLISLVRSSCGEDASSTAAAVTADDDDIDSNGDVKVIESLAGVSLNLPCPFVNKVYSPNYDATWIVEWKKREQGADTGK